MTHVSHCSSLVSNLLDSKNILQMMRIMGDHGDGANCGVLWAKFWGLVSLV